jgi:ferredoxin-thioredoxin reductase catalytic subunit
VSFETNGREEMIIMDENKDEVKKYSCPMHSEIHSEKKGKCPKCGMFLVEESQENRNEQ